jgi:cbb3-type cytochrome oxidase cytochrome c subunit
MKRSTRAVESTCRGDGIGWRGLVAGVLLFLGAPLRAAEFDAELRAGLVATFRDGATPRPTEIIRLEPTIALQLKTGESAHPRLRPDGSVVWQGQVNVPRNGGYRFRVRLRGQFRLLVGPQEALRAEVSGAEPALKDGPEIQLKGGRLSLQAEFTRLPGLARVEVVWQGPGFREEPLPYEAVGHLPDKAPARLAADTLAERGRYLAEELNCFRCHKAEENKVAAGLAWRPAPDLSRVGERISPVWLDRWLLAPRELLPGAIMPEMFPRTAQGGVERYAVGRYLASLGGPFKHEPARPRHDDGGLRRGEQLFAAVGCVVCHGGGREDEKPTLAGSFYGTRSSYPLRTLGTKTSADRLSAYLRNPHVIDPAGRMPNMLLTPNESADLARFLCQSRDEKLEAEAVVAPSRVQMVESFKRVENRPEELAEFEKLRANEQWQDLGKRLVIDRGCNNCHTIAPDGKPFATMQANADLDDLRKPTSQQSGCLANKAEKRGAAPLFDLKAEDRQALRAFLNEGLAGGGGPAPTHAARVTLQRYNCLTCHQRDGEGGLTKELTEQLRRFEKAETAEAVSPPPLTGVGHKLQTQWLRQVLVGAGRARPWMGLRMPQFGEIHVGQLADALAALEGTEADGVIHKVALTAGKLEAGRQLVGKNAFGCISCHDIAGIPTTGTRGPDLATTSQRVRYHWYLRWLEQPQRMQPGTRMPAVIADGKSLVGNVLNGNSEAQAEAMWGYLSQGNKLLLPVGVENPK